MESKGKLSIEGAENASPSKLPALINDFSRNMGEWYPDDAPKSLSLLKIILSLRDCETDEQFDAISRFADSVAHGEEHLRNETINRVHDIIQKKND